MNICSTNRFVAVFVAAMILPVSASAQEVLFVTPTSISVQASEGTTPPSQSVDISNDGNHALKWWIDSPTADWLSVSPTSGVQHDRVTRELRVKRTSGDALGIVHRKDRRIPPPLR